MASNVEALGPWLACLRAVAEGAKAGPWVARNDDGDVTVWAPACKEQRSDGERTFLCNIGANFQQVPVAFDADDANGKHIATFDRETTLAIIALAEAGMASADASRCWFTTEKCSAKPCPARCPACRALAAFYAAAERALAKGDSHGK